MRRPPLAAIAAMAMLAPAGAQERLPDGIVIMGNNDIAEAWLTRPTDRYAHDILGDAVEAGGLAVTTRDGKTLELVLPKQFVFEDRQARIHDLDDDGRDEDEVEVLAHAAGEREAGWRSASVSEGMPGSA